MTGKLNLFTLLIFAYSIVVCATFKKEGASITNSAAKMHVNKSSQDGIAFVKDVINKFPSITNFTNSFK